MNIVRTMLAATALMLAASPAFALEVGDKLGKTKDEIRQTLEDMGYEVRKIETEDGEYEAYAMKDGQRLEIFVNPAEGWVSRIKEDD